MKTKTILWGVLLAMVAMMGACKKGFNLDATLNRDCTGTYLTIDDKEYRICNPEKTASFAHADLVTVSFKKMEDCDGSGNFSPMCDRYHRYDSWVEMTKIELE